MVIYLLCWLLVNSLMRIVLPTVEKYVIVSNASDIKIENATNDGGTIRVLQNVTDMYSLINNYRSINDSSDVFVVMNNHISMNILKEFALYQKRIVYPDTTKAPDAPTFVYNEYYNSKFAESVRIHRLHPHAVGFVVQQNCSAGQVALLRTHIEISYGATLCTEISAQVNIPEILFALQIILDSKISHVLLLLSTNLLDHFLQRVIEYALDEVTFVTINLLLQDYQDIQSTYPRLTICNIRPSDMNNLYNVENNRMVIFPKYGDITDAIKIINRIFPKWRSSLQTDDPSIHTYPVVADRIDKHNGNVLKVVSVLDGDAVQSETNAFTIVGTCMRGIICKIPHLQNNKTTWQTSCCVGFIIDIFDMVMKDIDLAYEMYIVEDGRFGGYNNGTWNGIIYDVYTQKADVGAHAVTPTKHRHEVVDFTHNIMPFPLQLAFVTNKVPAETLLVNWSFVRHVHEYLLISVFGATILIIIIIYILDYIGYKMKVFKRYPKSEIFSYVTGILFQRDLGAVTPHHWSSRMVAIVFALGMTTFTSLYTAQLTAQEIDVQPAYTFHGIYDKKLQDPLYKLGYDANSSTELIFMQLQRRFNWTKGYPLKNIAEGVDSVVNRSLDAYFTEYMIVKKIVQREKRYCSVLDIHNEEAFQTEWAFAVQKGSYLRSKLSSSILTLIENGHVNRILQKWETPNTCPDLHEFRQYEWQYFGGWFVILGGATAFSIFALFAEHLYTHIHHKTVRKKYVVNAESRIECSNFSYKGSFRNKLTEISQNEIRVIRGAFISGAP